MRCRVRQEGDGHRAHHVRDRPGRKIEKTYGKVKAKGHAAEVLRIL